MLNLTRNIGESIFIGSPYDDNCVVVTTDRRCSFGITAPRELKILRYPEHFSELDISRLAPHVRDHMIRTGEVPR